MNDTSLNDRFEFDESFRKIFSIEIKLCGLPHCAVCGKELTNGDYVDHYFPDYQDRNICKECIGKR